MALIKFGGGVVGMAGSIAGTTFARNASGSYARARTKPINNNTTEQQRARDSMTCIVNRWLDTLTPVQRADWQTYAQNVSMKNRLGESIYLSGMNQYVRSNSILNQRAITLIDDAPTQYTLGEKDPTIAITISEATQQFSIAFDNTLGWAIEAGGSLFVYVSTGQNLSVNFHAGPWTFAKRVVGATPVAPTTPATGTMPYTVAEGQKVFAYARIARADGRLSEKFFCQCNVAA
jgi:hypothetical protein